MIVQLVADNFSDIFSDSGSDSDNSVIRTKPSKTLFPFQIIVSDSHDERTNDI